MDTVLVTGISGFIAKHVVLELLRQGCAVRGTVRSLAGADDVRRTLIAQGADVSRLGFVAADLDHDAGWAEAVAGCRYVQHIASPFPLEVVDDREALVPAARDGALRVLDAALQAGVERVVMTSSMVAMMYRPGRPAECRVTEGDWTDPEWAPLTPYIVSKTRAEQAAWARMRDAGASAGLTTVNPGFVLGPLLDAKSSTSIDVVKMFLTGAYPALPPVAFPVVDVRDLAAVQVRAMTAQEAGGRRLIAAGETITMREMAFALRAAFPARRRRIPQWVLPAGVVRFAGIFDRALRALRGDLGVTPIADSAYVTALTGVGFRPAAEAVVAAGRSLEAMGLV
ncbi:MAG: NAD-dependent epimerase/dehydratase family protein [Gammaproteobacteria bacterium]